MPLTVDTFTEFPEWQQVLLILLAAVVLARVIRWLIEQWINQSTILERTELDRLLLTEINHPLYISVILSGLYVSLPLLGFPRLSFVIGAAILTVIVIVWVRAGVRLGGKLATYLREDGRDREYMPVLKNVWTFFLMLSGFFLLLGIWEIDITPLLASAGVMGIILGIAAQDSIGNLFAGISLNLDQTYAVGDVLQLEDGTRGTVTDISVRSTTLLTRNNVAVTIPNSELNQTKLINESSPQRRRRIQLDVGVAYGSELEAVEETLLALADEEPLVLDSPAPVVKFREFGDSAIRAQLQVYIKHPALLGRTRDALIRRISSEFNSADIKIPFPQRELTFDDVNNRVQVVDPDADT